MRNLRSPIFAFLIGLAAVWYMMQPKEGTQQQQDPLTDIIGIGPVFERALNAAGIYSFRQLAGYTPEALALKLRGITTISPDRIRSERWIEQAQELRQG